MIWQKVREQFPNQWLLVEAIKAYSDQGKRIVEDLSVVEVFSDSLSAMRKYGELHHEHPTREFLVLHTEREIIEITERYWVGIRG